MWTHRLFASLSRVIVIRGGDDVIMMVISTQPGARRCLTAYTCIWVCVYVCVCMCERKRERERERERDRQTDCVSVHALPSP